MDVTNQDCEPAYRELLEVFFADHPDAALQKRALKALRFLTACDKPLAGKPAGWAAGIIYAVANRDRQACGVPGLLNSDFEAHFGATMGTIRKRAAQIARPLPPSTTSWPVLHSRRAIAVQKHWGQVGRRR